LLPHDIFDARFVGLLDERAHLSSEDAFGFGFLEQRGKRRNGLHQLDAILLSFEALIDFQEWYHTFYVPKIVSRTLVLYVPVHGILEQDGSNDPLPSEAGAGDHAGAHLVHERKHLILVRPRAFFNSIKSQRLWRATTALIQRCDEARV